MTVHRVSKHIKERLPLPVDEWYFIVSNKMATWHFKFELLTCSSDVSWKSLLVDECYGTRSILSSEKTKDIKKYKFIFTFSSLNLSFPVIKIHSQCLHAYELHHNFKLCIQNLINLSKCQMLYCTINWLFSDSSSGITNWLWWAEASESKWDSNVVAG